MSINRAALDQAYAARKAYRANTPISLYSIEGEDTVFIAAYLEAARTVAGMGDEITDKEIFIEKMYVVLKAGKIRDFDTNWRMTNQIMPPNLECIHTKDAAEISGSYRKIHLSDVIATARDIVNHYHRMVPKP